ncbi:MAG: aminomethyl-transferring glycine dehydrogenase [Chthonomonadales bacterium]
MFSQKSEFIQRHIGPKPAEVKDMLSVVGATSLNDLVNRTLPESIRKASKPIGKFVGDGMSEADSLARLKELASANKIAKSYIGMGYSDCFTPSVILRNLIEDPRWYTPYTPYQSEVSQGRLEALLNFQTMVIDLTGMEIANASMLDEATSAAEAMTMSLAVKGHDGRSLFVSTVCHPQTIALVKTRAEAIGIPVLVGCHKEIDWSTKFAGVLVQYPATDGSIDDFRSLIETAHAHDALVVTAADIMALNLLIPPGELGADIAVGNTQRFGIPMGYGGPHAAYFATKDAHKRLIPGRLVGVSKDAAGNRAVRLAMQTREQHIRRDKATSNICTAQALLANAAAMFAVYHGPEGVRAIAERIAARATQLASGLNQVGFTPIHSNFFDTVAVVTGEHTDVILARAETKGINFRKLTASTITLSVDETTSIADLSAILDVFKPGSAVSIEEDTSNHLPKSLLRTSPTLSHPVFNKYHSETEMMRYLNELISKDVSLAHSMIPLGSCTMKLNAATEMIPVTWAEFGKIHPFAPDSQVKGYKSLIDDLEGMLCEITGFAAVSLQPNAGSQGEYAGLLVIRAYHHHRGDTGRNVCLIPQSAHGTNPASAAMVGMKIVVIKTDGDGNIDIDDLRAKAEEYKDDLAALMVTYPSTHGVFEEGIVDICKIIHERGGQVYMDGANMNAQVGLCRPGDFGPDVCHLNLHKTFCIPHGGGGPGMGPIGVASHLAPFLPGHPVVATGGKEGVGAVSAAPFGSPSILTIPYAYIKMMGAAGLKYATEVAILNANYMAARLDPYFPVLYKGAHGFVAHECIIDLRPIKARTGVEVEDVAKRLMDYGFHAPTVSFPVPGTMMIEPTESEPKAELDRFCDAMISIHGEIMEIEEGKADAQNNVLKRAPHTCIAVTANEWDRPYSREKAAYPVSGLMHNKYWAPVARIDNVYGDRNLVCACPPIEDYE